MRWWAETRHEEMRRENSRWRRDMMEERRRDEGWTQMRWQRRVEMTQKHQIRKKMGQNKQNFFFYLTIWKKMWRSIKRQGEKRIDETRQRQEVHWCLFSSLSPALLCITAHWDTFTQTRWSWAGAQMINGVNAMTAENLSARPYPGHSSSGSSVCFLNIH